jgi:putative endonuclease
MITVYVIESLSDQTWYTGMAKNANARLHEHIFTEQHPDWETARKREKYLKSSAGKKWLKKFLFPDGGDTSSLPG